MEKHIKIIEPYAVTLKIDRKRSVSWRALLKAYAISLLIGLSYGISIFILGTNIALFPMMGVAAVSYVYNSNCREENAGVFSRLILGLICSSQILSGFLICELLYSEIPLYPINIYLIIREYARYTLENPADQALPIFLMLVCFLYGALQDYVFRFQKILKRPFLRKRGDYYYKREGHIVSIFMIDPAEYRENEQNRLIAYITEGCYIEKSRHRVKAFYLSKDNIDEAEIQIKNGIITKIKDKEYYKIDLGSNGEYQSYEAPCSLILDETQNVELIIIQI